ncbi:MMPL family transporter [Jiangella aurantiaca]|uniref:MMPL family transporter n=1 Tax=Jiangella aurantiaca TaxID=2530373 RepID=A0A4R5ALE0_9ACTN|nr:MMPL family transporter [Jiangella aurantiaca]TDD72715.1 MMPL family transporter [Jiangella aurantiaca]
MFTFLGRATTRRRGAVLIGALVLVLVGGVWGTGVFGSLTGEAGFDDPDSESVRATATIEDGIGRTAVDVLALYRSDDATVDDQAFESAVTAVADDLTASDAVSVVRSYYSTGSETFVSSDRSSTYVAIQLAGDDAAARADSYDAVSDLLVAPGLDVELGGQVPMGQEINGQIQGDIARAELMAMPILLVLMVVIFRSAVAALLPLAVGALCIMGSFVVLRLITMVTDVSVFSVNLVTMLGLGLAIDYALFIVSRFREELPASATPAEAVIRTMRTAGRTVAFSGLTLAVSLLSLLFFPQVFLRSMGLGGVATVLFALVGALVVLPALLVVIGRRIDSWRIPSPRKAAGRDGERWYRVAHAVMRRPGVVTAGIVGVLVALGLPFLRVDWGMADARVLPERTEARQVAEALGDEFPADPAAAITVAVTLADPVDSPAGRSALEDFTARLTAVPGVDGVDPSGAAGDTAALSVRYAAEPQSGEAMELLTALRALPPPGGGEALFTGGPAGLADLLDSVGSRLPWMGLFVGVVSIVLLFLAFGSLILPIKSIVMNLLSLSAAFGAIVLIFQDGHLSGPLGFTPTGLVDATMPVLMIAIAFGLAMDYEVFLVSRIREQWDRTGDHVESIATGVQKTAKIITAAALLLVIVVGAFATSGVTFIKMVGIGLVVAIVVDATIVRALLVPATMRLLGRRCWWAPPPMRRWWDRHGFREDEWAGASSDEAPRPADVVSGTARP